MVKGEGENTFLNSLKIGKNCTLVSFEKNTLPQNKYILLFTDIFKNVPY